MLTHETTKLYNRFNGTNLTPEELSEILRNAPVESTAKEIVLVGRHDGRQKKIAPRSWYPLTARTHQ